MSEKIADFELKHRGTSYSQNDDGNLVATVNWETEGDMDVYGAVYGTLTVIHDYCLLYTSPSPRDRTRSRMPSSA